LFQPLDGNFNQKVLTVEIPRHIRVNTLEPGSIGWVHLDTVLTMGGETVPHRQKVKQQTSDQKRSKAVGHLGRRGTGSGG
jgi:hypothetical protein